MKKVLVCGIALASLAAANADIRFNAAPEFHGKTLKVETVSINDMLTKSRKEITPQVFDATISAEFTLLTPGNGAQRYTVRVADNEPVRFYALPSERVNITIAANGDLNISGTPLLDQIAGLEEILEKHILAYNAAAEKKDEAAAEVAYIAYTKALEDYVVANPGQPGAAWAVLEMDSEPMLKYAETLTGDAVSCIIYPLVQQSVAKAKARQQAEMRQQEMADSHAVAPNFSLPNLEGKTVNLSDFKGKWVVLDFWGSWCPWCIKGFPGLKEVYTKYAGKLEIVGVDCNDPEANWRAAVKKYALPWVNVYNAQTKGGVLEAYGVQAFPTKVLVNPNGKIEKIYVGEDPAFYTDLDGLIK